MDFRYLTARFFALMTVTAIALAAAAPGTVAREKTVWNYDGGIFLETDGTLSNGICFRVAGRVTSGHFFEDLKRIDDKGVDTMFVRGKETVTQFPEQLLLAFTIFDMPCSSKLKETGTRAYLTRSIVSNLHLSLFWKRGVDLRSITDFKPVGFSVRPIFPFNPEATDVPEKFEWFYELVVPSVGVPLTDSLVLVIRTPEDQVAARVAARM
jgi:hypothetical protein